MPESSWLDEIELDPTASPVVMGIRSLGQRPWLVADAHRERELALKAELSRTRPGEVFAAEAGTEGAGRAVIDLLQEAGVEVDEQPGRHPLDSAGRSVQEDLCLMERTDAGWHLAAASLCFPSRWRLADKIGRHITEIHGPVDGYADKLAERVDGFFDRVTDKPVWRRNWFVHADNALFQPTRPPGGDVLVPASRCLDDLVVRSERQTLRRLQLADDWILFTIRVQQAPVRELLASATRRAAFRDYLTTSPSGVLQHRGMAPLQVAELQTALRDKRLT